jgi:CoA transferase family III
MLAELGAQPGRDAPGSAVQLGTRRVTAVPSNVDDDWRASSVAGLTGRPGGPELMPKGAPATAARALGFAISVLGGPAIDGAAALGARVGLLPLRRGGERSAGGAARLLRAPDGWIALSLPRASDRELVPALIGEATSSVDPWPAITTWVRDQSAAAVVDRGALLGLAVARVGEAPGHRVPWTLRSVQVDPAGAHPQSSPGRQVVNLGALWAGPLCAQILCRAGWHISDVVSTRRSDATRSAVREVLHAGHQQVAVDFGTQDGRRKLGELLRNADVVIEASRPRALRQLGVDAETLMADGRRRTWVRITGHGPAHERVAFGDDAAAAGGLVAEDDHGPVFAGDAIADPLAGLTGALLTLACAHSPAGWVVDVPMASVAAWAAGQ